MRVADDRSLSYRDEGSSSKSRRTRFEPCGDPATYRRHDKAAMLDGQGDVIPLYRGWKEPLLYFDWFFRPWVYLDSPAHFVSWYSCAGFFFGGMCFIIGSFTSITPWIYDSDVYGNCMGDTYDWCVNLTFFLGNVFWMPAVWFQMLEAQNHDWEPKYEEWYLGGQLGKPPRYRIFAFYYWSLEWWGATCYTVGVVGYNMAAITAIIYDCKVFNTDTYTGLTTYVYMGSGILFLMAGGLYCMQFINIWLFPAIFVPYRKGDATSMMWWALWLYWWGGVGFCMTGLFYYWDSFINDVVSFGAYQWVQGIGFGGGAFFFMTGAGLLLARQSRGRCRPSFQQVHDRLDRTQRADPGATAKAHVPDGFTKVSVDPMDSNVGAGHYGNHVHAAKPIDDDYAGINGANGHARV